jgi:hypothetical protein
MARIAFTTFAIMKAPYGDPMVQGFEALTPGVFRHAEKAEGFIDRARELDGNNHLTNFERDWGGWGPFAVPRFYDGGFETVNDTRASTLSLWSSLEAVRVFSFGGLHGRALVQRGKWFRKPEWPTYAAWWVGDAHIPTWKEAATRLEALHDRGPTAFAFTFSDAYDAEGGPMSPSPCEAAG